jgi:hypothetical protein
LISIFWGTTHAEKNSVRAQHSAKTHFELLERLLLLLLLELLLLAPSRRQLDNTRSHLGGEFHATGACGTGHF